MTRPGRDKPNPEMLRLAFLAEASRIGLKKELPQAQIVARDKGLQNQVTIGMRRVGEPTTEDLGLLAIRTGIQSIKDAFPKVPLGKPSITWVLDRGGTKWDTFRAEKKRDDTDPDIPEAERPTTIDIKLVNRIVHPEDTPKPVTWDEFITMMVEPVAKAYHKITQEEEPDEPVNIAVNFGFPHTNINRENGNGIDAVLTGVKEDGILPKGWRITNWNELDEKNKGNVTIAIKEKLIELGVNIGQDQTVENILFPEDARHIKQPSVVTINDTHGTEFDEIAAEEALRNKEFIDFAGRNNLTIEIVEGGLVGGTGTNSAVGDINLESGHGKFYKEDRETILDTPEEEDLIHQRMVQDGLVTGKPEFEHETGQAIRFRIVTALRMLHEKKLLDGGAELADKLLRSTISDPGLMDRIASGEYETDKFSRFVVQSEIKRAEQNYGIIIANTLRAAYLEQELDPKKLYILRTDGSMIFKGHGIKRDAEKVASELLGVHIRLAEASGARGAAACAMSQRYRSEYTPAT